MDIQEPTHDIFMPRQLGGVSLQNGIIRSATHEGLADERGAPTEKLLRLYRRLAKGEAGAIITGYAAIRQDGLSHNSHMLRLDSDSLIAPYQRLVAEVKVDHDTPLIAQLAHCGSQTRRAISGCQPMAPSTLRDPFFDEEIPQAFDEAQLKSLIDDFVAAIGRAHAAGFDAVQLHCAHGYLLSQFFSPFSNRRTDRWGGSAKNRARVVTTIMQRAKQRYPDFPIWVKLNAHDRRSNGMRVSRAVKIASLLAANGCDAIEVSCGCFADGLNTIRGAVPIEAAFAFSYKFKSWPSWFKTAVKPLAKRMVSAPKPYEGYNVPAARAIKQAVSVPVVVVGGLHSRKAIEDVIARGDADAVSMCRPFIAEPTIVQKLRTKRQAASRCTCCNFCGMAIEETPLRCYLGKLPKT